MRQHALQSCKLPGAPLLHPSKPDRRRVPTPSRNRQPQIQAQKMQLLGGLAMLRLLSVLQLLRRPGGASYTPAAAATPPTPLQTLRRLKGAGG